MIKRSEKKDGMIYRFKTDAVDGFRPSTLDEKTRSVEAVAVTEDPSAVWDPNRNEVVNEVLLMSGAKIPRSAKIPLTIEHERSSGSVIGSFSEMRVEGGELVGRVYFSTAADAEPFYIKVREGHLNSFSITYPADSRDSVFIAEGETSVINGRSYHGPILVTKTWKPKALGLVLFPADENATARTEPTQEKERKEMNNKLRKMLERHGLATTATDEEAELYLERYADDIFKAEKKADPPPAVDVDKIRSEAVGEERSRITEIDTMCDRFGIEKDMANGFVSNGVSADMARKKIMDILVERDAAKAKPPVSTPTTIIADEKDKFRSAAEDALIIRSGSKMVEKPAAGASDLTGLSLVEIARHSLRIAGQKSHGSPLEMVGRAMTTSDFPYILSNVANKSLMAGWETTPTTWQTWCGTGSVSNFLTHTLVNVSEFSNLDEIPEASEYKYGIRTETKEEYKVLTYGKMAAITRQAVINDDLNAITSNFMGMGEAAARKVNELPYAVLVANAVMGDGVALFDVSTHVNYVTSGGAPGVATIAAMILAMGTQKDLQGLSSLNISPEYIIMPRALEGATEVFFQSTAFSDHSTVATDSSFASTRVNPYSGPRFTRVYDGYFDANSLAAGWFGAARKGKTVNVYFLNGVQTPYMEMQNGWNVDGVEYKVRIDAGAKAVDWRGLFWNDGS